MSDLIMIISEFCCDLEKQYYTMDEPYRSKAGAEFEKMSLVLRETVSRELRKNDKCYEEAVTLIMKVSKDLQQVKKGVMGTETFIQNICGIADKLDRLISFFVV